MKHPVLSVGLQTSEVHKDKICAPLYIQIEQIPEERGMFHVDLPNIFLLCVFSNSFAKDLSRAISIFMGE